MVEYNPIGYIRTEYDTIEGIPVQSARSKETGIVEIREELKEGLSDLEGFSHLLLIYHFHLTQGFSLKDVSSYDNKERGIFSLRTPKRPNPIGISIVKLLKIEGNKLEFEGVDMLDGTPLLDIKPYIELFDSKAGTSTGWLNKDRWN
ncbi:MAG: tRNA (N6-threonylcarbamoyladenosine(37)-N6)-methyltransferase TrmO [Candidatus Nanoarchaeia archaeon]